MSPHSLKYTSPEDETQLKNKNKKLEILCDGFYYDVTDFIPRHPGGSVIAYYTEKGEDATQAIQQFHNRSSKKVQAILKSFKIRPADDLDLIMDSKKLARHQEMTKDVTNLYLDMQKEGLFKPSYVHVAYRIIEVILMYKISWLLIASPHLPIRVLALILGGITAGRAGFLVHETGHKALTGKPKIDAFIQSAFYGYLNGLSSNWWNRNHNRHHAMPQRLQHDIDLDTMPFMAYNARVIKDPKDGKSFWVQNQVWLFMSLNAFVGVMAWRLVHSPKNAIKRRNYLDLFFMTLHWYDIIFHYGLIRMCVITWVGANYMYGNFSLSHTHTPVTDESTHWLEYSLTHTVDVSHNVFVDWWMGHLNYQIEHHLFPTMPHFRARKIRSRVKALAEKYGLPYRILGFREAWQVTLQNISDVAKEFADYK